MWFVTTIIIFLVGGPITSACRGRVTSWYGVYGALAICYYGEPVVFRSFEPLPVTHGT
jgi:hypothetical protein